MTLPTDLPADLPSAGEEELAPLRSEAIVRVLLPDGTADEMTAGPDHVAYTLARTLARDYAAAGIDVTVTAITRTWALVDESEITDPFPD